MKTEIVLKKEGKPWSWQVEVRGVIAGGYCRTKKDALNDAKIWLRDAGKFYR